MVYIPIPTALKKVWVVKACRAGKHVLVEKPLGSAADAKEMVAACTSAGKQLMDGTAMMHNPRLEQVRAPPHIMDCIPTGWP